MTRSNRDLSKTRDNYVCTEVGDIEKICKCVSKRLHVFAFPGTILQNNLVITKEPGFPEKKKKRMILRNCKVVN